jgi:hypothetical protein
MATAHIYLLELGPELSHEEVDFLTYDDATQQLLVVKGGHVFAHDVSNGPAGHSSLKWMYPLQVCLQLQLLYACVGGWVAGLGVLSQMVILLPVRAVNVSHIVVQVLGGCCKHR